MNSANFRQFYRLYHMRWNSSLHGILHIFREKWTKSMSKYTECTLHTIFNYQINLEMDKTHLSILHLITVHYYKFLYWTTIAYFWTISDCTPNFDANRKNNLLCVAITQLFPRQVI
jgi:hypothetical protein